MVATPRRTRTKTSAGVKPLRRGTLRTPLPTSLSALCVRLGDKVPVNERARSEGLIEETRKAVQDESTTRERFQQLAGDLQQASQMIASAAYQQAGAGATRDGRREAGRDDYPRGEYGPRPGGRDDVIDAEFTEH